MRLNSASVASTEATVFPYDRSNILPGIVHLGVGAFHRAHQAVYIDQLLSTDPSWGIIGASLRRADAADALNPQDGLYTLAVKDTAGAKYRIVGSLLSVIDASGNREPLLERMTDPAIRIVSLTITEKGYCLDPATGTLDRRHRDIVADLAAPHEPRSAIGIIVEALSRRRQSGTMPFTVLSCDNLPDNGQVTKNAVVELANLRDKALGNWISANVTFPGTMVDRIVPATTEEDRQVISRITGLEDAAPVMTEPFTQWVVVDDFSAGRPALETVGVQIVNNVEPFEKMKLRMLNGSHSTLAYLGYLKGHETVADAIADPQLETLIHEMMTNEIIPTLDMPDGTDLLAYRDSLIERFRNRALKHRTWQIAMDGSQKLPQRLLNTIRDRLAAGKSFDHLAAGVAGWMRYVTGTDLSGNPIDVRDPLAEPLKEIGRKHKGDFVGLVRSYVQIEAIFGRDLCRNQEFIKGITAALKAHFA